MTREQTVTPARTDTLPDAHQPPTGAIVDGAADRPAPTATSGSIPLSDVLDHVHVDTGTAPDRGPRGPRRPARRGLILGIVLIAQLMEVLDTSIVNIALPDIAGALSFSPTSLSWVINAYTLTFGGLLLLGARAGDIFGRRRVFTIGITVFTLASLAGGFAQSGGVLLLARAIQGAGAAFAAPSALAILMTLFPDARERTRAIGWFSAVSVGGAAIGLIAGGMLTQWASWRWVMFVNVPIGAALIVGIVVTVPHFARSRGRIDLAGALTSTLGMSAVVFGLVRAAGTRWDDPLVLAGLVGGTLLLTAFLAVERRVATPIVPLRLFADRNRSTAHLVRLLMVAGMFGMFFFLSQFVQEVLGYGPLQAGLAFLPLTGFLFVMAQVTARILAPRIPDRSLMLLGLPLASAGLLTASSLDVSSGYVSLLVPLALFGIGAGMTFVPMTSIALHGVEPADAGAASGLVNVSQQVGGAVGLAILVSVFGHATAPDPTRLSGAALTAARAAFVAGEQRALLVAGALTAAAAVLTAVAIRRRSTDGAGAQARTSAPSPPQRVWNVPGRSTRR